MSTVRIDAQGRIVVPLAHRQRLGVQGGDELALIPTPEGLILERRRAATVSTALDGLPIVEFTEPRLVTNDEAIGAIRAQRDARRSTRPCSSPGSSRNTSPTPEPARMSSQRPQAHSLPQSSPRPGRHCVEAGTALATLDRQQAAGAREIDGLSVELLV